MQEAALAHPLVKRAQEIFKAEVRSVVDLAPEVTAALKQTGEYGMINPLKISEMLSQASQMQEEVQRKLGETVVEATSGGGAVTATMNGKKELLKLHIDPAAVTEPERRPARRGDAGGPDRGRGERSRPQGG